MTTTTPPHIAALVHNEHVKYIRRRNSDGFRLKYALGHAERKQLIQEAGVFCLVLFEYYLRLASTENAPISDEDAADYFGWSRNTAQRHRLALIKSGWYARENAKLGNNRKVQVHYLGKDEVTAAGLKPRALVAPSDKPTQSMFILPKEEDDE